MQLDIAAAIRRAAPEGARAMTQSDRMKHVVDGRNAPCGTLECLFDERIAAGASRDAVMDVVATIGMHVGAKLEARDRRPGPTVEDAILAETAIEGEANEAQMRVMRDRCPVERRRALPTVRRHYRALGIVIEAMERLAAREAVL